MGKDLLISSYNNFKILAHQPKGTESEYGITLNDKKYILDQNVNPAFILQHPKLNFIYMCYESIKDGRIGTFSLNKNKDTKEIELKEVNSVSSGGKSSCYLIFDSNLENIININYWDSTISLHTLREGILEEPRYIYVSKQKHIAQNMEQHLANRQSEPHFHSAVFWNNMLLVPDLGIDQIHFFSYQPNLINQPIKLIGDYQIDKNNGPRYLRIKEDFLYVINEIRSSISVFYLKLDKDTMNSKNSLPTINLIQNISTLPLNYLDYNTSSNIMIHPNQNFIFASNRGHNSISVFKINNINNDNKGNDNKGTDNKGNNKLK